MSDLSAAQVSRRRMLQSLGFSAMALGLGGLSPHIAFAQQGGAAAPSPAPTRQPNILFILMDDMGWMDLSCQGSELYRSPNVDKLAAQSMRFTSAYAACPVCSPTRASILTGRYPATVNLTDYIPGHSFPYAKLRVPEFNQQLPHSEFTIAQALKEAGYKTAIIGKWHLGAAPNTPDKYGFDHVVDKVPNDDDKMAAALTAEACKFLEANKDRPFFLYLAHHAPHLPIQAKPELIEKYKPLAKPDAEQNNPAYAAMIEATDKTIGTLLAKLDELQLADNTVVIFTSDNGGLKDKNGKRITSNAPLRGGKGMLYEGGIREPLFIRWPGVIRPGSTCDDVVCTIDFFPTLLEIAGAKPKLRPIDGVSLMPLLRQTGRLDRRAVYWHYPHYHMEKPSGAIRQGDLKLIEFYEDGRLELYNVKDDPGEKRNLVTELPHEAYKLRRELALWRQRVGAKMPKPNPDYDPAKADQQSTAAGKAKVEE